MIQSVVVTLRVTTVLTRSVRTTLSDPPAVEAAPVRRIVLFLPLCLIVAPGRPDAGPTARPPAPVLNIAANETIPTPERLEQLALNGPPEAIVAALKHD